MPNKPKKSKAASLPATPGATTPPIVAVSSLDVARFRRAANKATAPPSVRVDALKDALTPSLAKYKAKALVPPASALPAKGEPPSEQQKQEFLEGLKEIQAESETYGDDVLHSPRDEKGSLVQAALAAAARRGVLGTERVMAQLPGAGDALAGAVPTRVKFATEDIAGALSWAITWLEGHALGKRPVFPPPKSIPTKLPFRRVALFADWGTNMYGAPAVRNAIRADLANLDLVIHLGDTYYAGLPDEMQARVMSQWPFTTPMTPSVVHRSLNGNHEMYGSGVAYFGALMPLLRQTESAFSFSNGSWLIVGLDTAYKDHNLSKSQVDWLDRLLKHAKDESLKVILLSHHQLFDFARDAGSKLRDKVENLENLDQVEAWYWGHEHHAAIYERSGPYGFHGRCLGNGGMPELRRKLGNGAIHTDLTAGYAWRRFDAPANWYSPAGIVLDGPNLARDMPLARQQDFAPHGYVVLEFAGTDLYEEFWVVNWDGYAPRRVYRGLLGAAL